MKSIKFGFFLSRIVPMNIPKAKLVKVMINKVLATDNVLLPISTADHMINIRYNPNLKLFRNAYNRYVDLVYNYILNPGIIL